jgi:hypothetical protein
MRNLPTTEPETGPELVDTRRRSLLQVGLFGSLLLGAAGATATLSGCTGRVESTAAGYRFLRDADLPLMRALVPVVLDSMLPADGAERDRMLDDLLQHIDLGCYRLGHPARKVVAQLFDLLNMRLTRWPLTGVGAWEQATPAQVQAFLERWRTSSFAMFNAGYRALVKLISVSFYGTRAGWAAANYPGPPPGPYQVFNS